MPKKDKDGSYVYNEYGNIVYEEKKKELVDADSIAYDTYDFNFNEQSMEVMKLANAVVYSQDEDSDEGDTEAKPDIDGINEGIYLTASSAKVSVKKPAGTIRSDLNYVRVQVNDPDSSVIIAEDPHVKQSYETVTYLDQVSNDKTSLNEFVVNYNLANHATQVGKG